MTETRIQVGGERPYEVIVGTGIPACDHCSLSWARSATAASNSIPSRRNARATRPHGHNQFVGVLHR